MKQLLVGDYVYYAFWAGVILLGGGSGLFLLWRIDQKLGMLLRIWSR